MSDDFIERVWAYREEQVYPALFGDLGEGIYPLNDKTFAAFEQEPDARWLFTGVFESAPSDKHEGWVYVSSGLSTPWEQEGPAQSRDEASWLGLELVFHTEEQSDWAIHLVQRIAAFEILLAHGCFPGRERLSFGDRIPIRGPLVPGSDSALTYLLLAPREPDTQQFQLESGFVDLVQLVGITDGEAAFAREHGLAPLLDVLRKGNAHAITRPWRASLV
ncbi:MAG: suppressor of fused domain protein [Polyangiaceae bacterium]|nr:suppressor of fused domain protein [Polyangiaceae bacterium]